MFVAGRYQIDNNFKVYNIITEDNPEGDYIYDPFDQTHYTETLPFWGVMCTTFWGLNNPNRQYLIKHTPKEELQDLQFKKFWLFWFADGELNNQKELMFFGDNEVAKQKAYAVQQIFNHLLEKQVDKLISNAKEQFQDGLNIGGVSGDISEHIMNANN